MGSLMNAPFSGPILFCDLDGTLLPHAYNTADGSLRTPTFKEGPAFPHIIRWLQLGGRLVAVTGSSPSTHTERFWDDIPRQLCGNGQVLFAVDTGASLYLQDPNGSLVEVRHNMRTSCVKAVLLVFSMCLWVNVRRTNLVVLQTQT
jgi:hypothetical protein